MSMTLYAAVGSALVGALLVSRCQPKTKCRKKSLLGPKTGATYQVEDFASAGFIVVAAADGSQAIFQRKAASPTGGRGFAWQHGKGNPATLRAIYIDVMGEEPPKTAVGPKAVPRPGARPTAVPNAAAGGASAASAASAAAAGPRVAGKKPQATRGTP